MNSAADPGDRRATGVEDRTEWWGRSWLLPTLMLAATFPLWFVSLPPLIDFLGHLGRYRIQIDLAHSPLLQRNWAYEWQLIGNLGVDLLIVPLEAIFGLERAGWIVAAALPPLMIWGMVRAARAVHGHLPPTALAAIPFALAYPYQYGFVNFWLATGLAFHAFATWVQWEDRPGRRAALFVPIAAVIWVSHVYGWGILGILIGGYELARAHADGGRNLVRIGLRVVSNCWPLLLPLILMVIWRDNGEGAVTLGWFRWHAKFSTLAYTLRDQLQILDVVSLILAAMLIVAGLRDRRFIFDPRLGVAAGLFLLLIALLPYQLFGSAFADSRLWPIAFMTALLAIRPRERWGFRPARVIAAIAVAVFAARIAVGAFGYAQYDRDHQRHLRALDWVERGSSVAVFVRFPCREGWRLPRLEHMGSMAVVRREAFVNAQWDVPGAQLLKPLRARGTAFNADPSQFVAVAGRCPRDMRPLLDWRLAVMPRHLFDTVWVLGFDPRTLRDYPGLTPIYQDEASILYRIEEEGQ